MNERGGAEVRGRRRGQKERRKEIRDRKEEAEEKVKSKGEKRVLTSGWTEGRDFHSEQYDIRHS